RLYSFFFFSSRRRHTRFSRDWSSDVCSSDLHAKSISRAATIGQTTAIDKAQSASGPSHGVGIAHPTRRPLLIATPKASPRNGVRSEERRVGKEGRCRWSLGHAYKRGE